MAAKKALVEIKEDLDACVGKKFRLRANRGRKKFFERVGILESTYPHVFVIKLEGGQESSRRVSFSYTDVLTETVELTLCEEES